MSLLAKLFPARPDRPPAGFDIWAPRPVEPPAPEFDGTDAEYAEALDALASVAAQRPARSRRRTPS